jgi:heme-degrading monooxygenase HmoA
MYVLAINHKVNDYNQWKSVFDTFPPSKGGATFHRVNRDVDDPNNVTVVAGFDTADAARAFRGNAELKGAMGEAGIAGAPRFEIYEEVESQQY